MPIKRITISVPSGLAAKVKRAAGNKPVSAYIASVLEEKLDEAQLEHAWREYIEDVKPTAADERRVDRALARLRKRRPKRAA